MPAEETLWIVLKDGCRLAARLWLPEGEGPAPAVLEYLPYRRRDRHRGDDAILHPGLAAAGYAAIRVDMRGSGDSDGTMDDEYTPQEWADANEVIAWIAAQHWCSGAVGLIGLSWSAFNALQIAATRPPALKAIVTTCGSDDRFADDMHYMGGALLNDNLQYGSTLFTWLAPPPDPEIVGERWRAMWLDRMNAISEPPAARWMRHADRDAYWQSGSVCEDYARIEVPVLAVGGWADGYTNAVHRLLSHLSGPRKGVIGPGGHAYSHVATPGPGFDFIGLAARWFDRWMKGVDNGVEAEPMLTAWMQDYEPPRPQYERRAGCWVAEAHWPSANVETRTFNLAADALRAEAGARFAASVKSPATVGLASGEWCPYGWGPDMPGDQREDDAGSACFDTAPLDEPLAILGRPEVKLVLTVDGPEAVLALRLNAVAPEGTSARVTYGLINLAHRDGFAHGKPLVPGSRIEVRVPLKVTGYRVPAGHRLRLAVSTQYWPLTMPLPVVATATIEQGSLALPVRRGEGPGAPDLGAPWSPPPLETDVIEAPARGRLVITHEVATGRATVEVVRNLGAIRIRETGLELRALGSETYSTVRDDPGEASSFAFRKAEFIRGDWQARIETRSMLTATATGWRLHAEYDAYDHGERIFAREWTIETPRAGMSGDGV
ncbi:CocE/NonD family hydrolase [Ancylobacter sp. MQZ15Z-1]|uniref:CocE/NonD family hydrolase n=1 Tax=Ancylobacter mangrovi TaxID=2972472 RepID=A0A9X2PJZ7_9HYPH|nr:CocE/NonD family hydrolase [Ancylobacter mangrovi]MCS0496622.1 CocE/NonD family hydrolase [Ancylobacter mangrovi]